MPYNPNNLGFATLQQLAGRATPQELRYQHLLSQSTSGLGLGSGIRRGMEEAIAEQEANDARQNQLAMTNALEFISSIPDDGNNFQIKQQLLQELIGVAGGKKSRSGGGGGKSGIGAKLLGLFRPSGAITRDGDIGSQIESIMGKYLPGQQNAGMAGGTAGATAPQAGRLDLTGAGGGQEKPFTGQVYWQGDKPYTITTDTKTGRPTMHPIDIVGLKSEKRIIAETSAEEKQKQLEQRQQFQKEMAVFRQNNSLMKEILLSKGMFADEFYKLSIEEQIAAAREVGFDKARQGDLKTQETLARIDNLRANSQLKTTQATQAANSGGVSAGGSLSDIRGIESRANELQKSYNSAISDARALKRALDKKDPRTPKEIELARIMNPAQENSVTKRREAMQLAYDKLVEQMKQMAEQASSPDMKKYFTIGNDGDLPTIKFNGIGRTPGALPGRSQGGQGGQAGQAGQGTNAQTTQKPNLVSEAGLRVLPPARNGKQLVAIKKDWFQSRGGGDPEAMAVGTLIKDEKMNVTYVFKGKKGDEYILEVK